MTSSREKTIEDLYGRHFRLFDRIICQTTGLLFFFIFIDGLIALSLLGVNKQFYYNDVVESSLVLILFVANSLECSLFMTIFKINMEFDLKYIKPSNKKWVSEIVNRFTNAFVAFKVIMSILYIIFVSINFPYIGNGYPYPYTIMYFFFSVLVDITLMFSIIRTLLYPT